MVEKEQLKLSELHKAKRPQDLQPNLHVNTQQPQNTPLAAGIHQLIMAKQFQMNHLILIPQLLETSHSMHSGTAQKSSPLALM